MSLIKYLKSFSYILIAVIIFNLIISILYYFNIIGSNIINYFKLIMIAISMLIGGIFIGINSNKKGWLEGIKIGVAIIIMFFIISYSAFDQGINIKTIIYYFILLSSSMLGSMIGINRKKGT